VIVVARGVLSGLELSQLEEQLASARFTDGAVSARGAAKAAKHALQLDRAEDAQREPGELVARALLRHPVVQNAVFPKSVRHPTINRYQAGMEYGPHLDMPLMTGGVTTRADVSATLFLCSPESYEGGELSIHCDTLPVNFKGQAGDAILYPSDSIHRVNALRSGTRTVAVTWFQSLFRDAAQRKILFDLGEALRAFEAASADTDALLKLRASYQNLQRRWLEA
jgi:PKHD-type hydroxylase